MTLIDPGKYWFGVFLIQKPNRKKRKKCLKAEFSQVFFGEMKPKNVSCQKLEWTKIFHSTKIECLFFDYSCLFFFFFFFNWMTLWTNKSQNFTWKWLEWKYFPSSEICNLIFLSAKDLAEFSLNLLIVSIFCFLFVLNVYGKISSRTFLLAIELILEFSSCPVSEIFSYSYRVSFNFAFSWWRTFQFCFLMIWKFHLLCETVKILHQLCLGLPLLIL